MTDSGTARCVMVEDETYSILNALASPQLAEWIGQCDVSKPFMTTAGRGHEVQRQAFSLAVSLARRDLFGISESEFARQIDQGREIAEELADGALPVELIVPALEEAVLQCRELCEQWKDCRLEPTEIPVVELIDEIDYLLESRLNLFSLVNLFRIEIDTWNGDRKSKAFYQVCGQLESLRSLAGRMDELIDDNDDIVVYIAETNWQNSILHNLPEDSLQPRPWWLTEELFRRYDYFVAVENEEREVFKSLPGAIQLTCNWIKPDAQHSIDSPSLEAAIPEPQFGLAASDGEESGETVAEFKPDPRKRGYKFLADSFVVKVIKPKESSYEVDPDDPGANSGALVKILVEIRCHDSAESMRIYKIGFQRRGSGRNDYDNFRDIELSRLPATGPNSTESVFHWESAEVSADLLALEDGPWDKIYLRRR